MKFLVTAIISRPTKKLHDSVYVHFEAKTFPLVGTIAKCRSSAKVVNTVKQLLYTTFRGNMLQEPISRSQYIQQQSSIQLQDSDLVISSDYPWLAASPDGLVEDTQYSPQQDTVEFKSPYTARDMTIREAVKDLKNFCLQQDEAGDICAPHTIIFIRYTLQWCVQIESGVTLLYAPIKT